MTVGVGVVGAVTGGSMILLINQEGEVVLSLLDSVMMEMRNK